MERKVALNSPAYTALRNVYVNRERTLEALKLSGKKVIWVFGATAPEEIIYAADMIPVRGWGCEGPWPESDKYLEASFGPVWRALFDAVMNGERRNIMDGLVYSSSATMLEKLGSYEKRISAREPEKKLPPIYSLPYDTFHEEEVMFPRNTKETRRFAAAMEEWAGKPITEKSLANAIKVYNGYRAALRKVIAYRKADDCRLTGCEALTIIGATLLMDKVIATSILKDLLKEMKDWPVVEATPIFYSGSQQENHMVYGLVEELGGNVVGEDHDWGNRVCDLDVAAEGDLYEAITYRYTHMMPSAEKSMVKTRVELVPRLIGECQAKGWMIYMNYNDEAFIWDYPTIKASLGGIPVFVAAKQRVPFKDKEKLTADITEFLQKARG